MHKQCAVFPAGSLARSYIPLIIAAVNTPATAPAFAQSGFDVPGRYIEFRSVLLPEFLLHGSIDR